MSLSSSKKNKIKRKSRAYMYHALIFCVFGFIFFMMFTHQNTFEVRLNDNQTTSTSSQYINRASLPSVPELPPLDTVAYDKKMMLLAHRSIDVSTTSTTSLAISLLVSTSTSTTTSTIITKATSNATTSRPAVIKKYLWPVKTVYPNAGALLPFNRIVAYYGNLYSTKMGILGEYPEDEMLQKLQTEVKKWEIADPTTPVRPALHYIVSTAQGSPGPDGKYRLRMPDTEIQKILDMAKKIDALVFLDVQTGLSTLQEELPLLEPYLKLPYVHLGIDPEFAMTTSGKKPGSTIGTLDAKDVNESAQFLARIVRENNLTPKILIVHRFTEEMVTNYQKIQPLPEVQIVMNMDGWGSKNLKLNTYLHVIHNEPVQFAGFKLFYKNDFREPNSRMMTPEEVLKITPQPIYIQYQ